MRRSQHENKTKALVWSLNAHTDPVTFENFMFSSSSGTGHKVPLLTKKSVATDTCWDGTSVFSKGVTLDRSTPAQDTPMIRAVG